MDGECVQGKKINTYKAMVRKNERKNCLEYLDVHWKILLKWSLMKYDGRPRSGFVMLSRRTI